MAHAEPARVIAPIALPLTVSISWICLMSHIQPLVRHASKQVVGRPYGSSVPVPRLAIVTFLVLGSIALVPGLNQLALTLLQIVILYFKTGMRG